MKSSIANPAPLGSLGFGMTTILFSIVSAGFFSMNSMLISMAIFLGGLGQLIAGILEYKKGNTFGFTSYTMFALYWFLIALMSISSGLMPSADSFFMGWFFLLWTIFTVMLFVCTLTLGKFTQFLFAVVVVLFATITIYQFTQIAWIGYLSGWFGILAGSLAMYSAFLGLKGSVRL